MKSYETILIDKAGGVTTIRFNRPDKRNAMNPQLHRDMYDALTELEFDDETKVLVITGQGEAFCAGQDLKEYFYEKKDDPRGREEARRMSHAWRHQKLRYFPRPTIAEINGWCFGGAFTVVASVDIAVAASEATFGLSEINFGHIPGGLVTKVVQEIVQPRQALYYILTGEPFTGARAAEIGLVTMAVPKAELHAKVMDIAATLMKKDPEAMRACKEVFKAVTPEVTYEDAWYWLSSKSDQLTYRQKGGWIEEGIGRFMKKEYRPGLGTPPPEKERA
ncbi:MAG: p-hydroxycinnamoyl CoA hydratase/lyase [Chloroflexota bacterium]|nr:p-hydroxycinnamoyl CoA hydratase/lyase [Chloroflexota bacterium]MDE3192599.1 p-hydroxycinnamoyl CoA hydratase/lyase [Chloroflexota bacterium]